MKQAGSGGVMYAYSSSITVGNSSFDNNEAGSAMVELCMQGTVVASL